MNYRNIPNFELGLLVSGQKSGRGKAPHTSLLNAENIRVYSSDAQLREGQSYLDADDLSDATIDTVYEYSREWSNGGVMNFYREYIYSAGTKLYAWEIGRDDYVEINDGYPLASSDVWIAEYTDWAIIGDGVNVPYKYDAIDYERVGIVKPSVLPIIGATAVGSGGVQSGTRRYKYRYARRKGGWTTLQDYTASPFSETHDPTDGEAHPIDGTFKNNNITVTVTASADPQVNKIELYGTKIVNAQELDQLDTATYYRLADLDNTTQVWTDNIAGGALGVNLTVYPVLSDTEDWTPPDAGLSLFVYYKDRIYGVNLLTDPSVLRYSAIGEPEQWPTDNWIDIRKDDGDVITALAVRGNSLYIFKKRSIYVVTGDPQASPMMGIVTGGEVTGNQTEFGLGCTAPRSLASYGDDALIFYNNVHGVWMLTGTSITRLSKNVNNLSGLSDECAGVVYTNDDNEAFYVLSQPSGVAYVCHIATGRWTYDTNVNVSCFCIDAQGRSIGGSGLKLNHYYDPDATDDNGTAIQGKMRHAWLNLRDGTMHAVVRGIQVQQENLDGVTMNLYNQTDVLQETQSPTSFDEPVGFSGIAGRLFSLEITWSAGSIESLTYLFLRRLGHSG